MPVFTAIALENLLESSVRESRKNSLPPKQESKRQSPLKKPPQHFYISPALYTTPKPAPIPDCQTSVSPSPYVVNRRLRDVPEPENQLDGFDIGRKEKSGDEGAGGGVASLGDEETVENLLDGEVNGVDGQGLVDGGLVEEKEILDDFLDPCDMIGAASSSEIDEGEYLRQVGFKGSSAASQGEFYDAPEEFFSDGSSSLASPSSSLNADAELRVARVNLLEEIEQRKKAEAALHAEHKHWKRLSQHLSEVGLSFPLTSDAENMELEIDSAEQLCQEVEVARFVSEVIGRGEARAEAEAAAEATINSKNQEIARLRDKLQYCEAVNHEMSQRNQEIIELSRLKRARKIRKRWMWGLFGMSVTLGTSLLAYSCLSHTYQDLPVTSIDRSGGPSVTLESSEAST